MFFNRWRDLRRRIERIEHGLTAILAKVDQIMVTENDLQADLDAIKAGVTALADKLSLQAATIGDLKAQLANGTPVSQAQLDALHTDAQGIVASLSGLTTPATPTA